MDLENEILINRYGQELISIERIEEYFTNLSLNDQRRYLKDLSYLIIQSKPLQEDIQEAIKYANINERFTPCVLLKKNKISTSSFDRIIQLPGNELKKSLKLFLSLFKVAYSRRFKNEKDDPTKWWYWDLSFLSDEKLLSKIHGKSS